MKVKPSGRRHDIEPLSERLARALRAAATNLVRGPNPTAAAVRNAADKLLDLYQLEHASDDIMRLVLLVLMQAARDNAAALRAARAAHKRRNARKKIQRLLKKLQARKVRLDQLLCRMKTGQGGVRG